MLGLGGRRLDPASSTQDLRTSPSLPPRYAPALLQLISEVSAEPWPTPEEACGLLLLIWESCLRAHTGFFKVGTEGLAPGTRAECQEGNSEAGILALLRWTEADHNFSLHQNEVAV